MVRFKTFNPHFEDDIKMCINTILKKLLKCFGHFSSNNKVFGELATVEINLGLSKIFNQNSYFNVKKSIYSFQGREYCVTF